MSRSSDESFRGDLVAFQAGGFRERRMISSNLQGPKTGYLPEHSERLGKEHQT